MRWVGLVRNVMLGRDGLHRVVLLEAATAAGAERVRSHLTTGNLTFDADPTEVDTVVGHLESSISRVVGRPTMVALRRHECLRDLVARDLFAGVPEQEWECEVAFLRHDAPALEPGRLPPTRRTGLVAAYDRELATVRPRTGGRRPHVTTLLERATGEPATARGWSTLCRLAADP